MVVHIIVRNVVEDVSKNVVDILKPITKVQDVDSENLTQALDSLHASDQPPNEETIIKVLEEESGKEPPTYVPVIYTFLDDIMNDTLMETEDFSEV